MTPLSGLVRRLLGGSDSAAPAKNTQQTARTASPTRTDSGKQTSDDRSEGGQRRRRGRRGGRGRGRGNGDEGGDASAGGSASQSEIPTRERGGRQQQDERSPSGGNGQRDEGRSGGRSRDGGRGGRSQNDDNRSQSEGRRDGGRGGRSQNDDNRSQSEGPRDGGRSRGGSGRGNKEGGSRNGGQSRKNNYQWGGGGGDDKDRGSIDQRRKRAGQRRGFRPSRESLEGPLPEDVAFRSVDAGGAGDILPARRRRPSGIRSTERVIVGGARSLSGIPRTLGGAKSDRAFESDEGGDRQPPRRQASRRDERRDARDEGTTESDAKLDQEQPKAVTDAPERAEGETAEDSDDGPKRRRGRRGGRRERERREARESALVRAEAEEDDEVPVDKDHAIEAIEELPAIIEQDVDEDEAPLEVPGAFADLGLSDESLAAIARLGHTDPTPIQARAIPELIDGNDVVGLAQTGSGKTLAFGLPMVERIDPDNEEVQAIVLVPTRELAQQVLEVLTDLGRSYGLRTVGLLGGHALKRDFAALRDQPQIVVGTPGRIIDHLRRETLSLRQVNYAVLDEADQMLDIGFLPDIRRILGRTPKSRQTALFSATMPTSIRRLIWQFMDDPVTAKVDAELSTVDTVEQIYFEVAQRDKTAAIRELVERELKGRTLVFCKMKRGVDHLARDLEGRGVRVGALHGDMDQRRRDREVERFREGSLDILIATNVAARGLDIPEITHVVNFDVPQNAEEYVHRIGRTGRAGRDGKAITFVGEWEFDEFQRVLDQFGEELTKHSLELYQND